MGLGLFSVTSWAASQIIGGIWQLLKHRNSDECRGQSAGKEVPKPGIKHVPLLRCRRQRFVGQCWLLSPLQAAVASAEFHTAGRGTTEGGSQVAGTHRPAAQPRLCLPGSRGCHTSWPRLMCFGHFLFHKRAEGRERQ